MVSLIIRPALKSRCVFDAALSRFVMRRCTDTAIPKFPLFFVESLHSIWWALSGCWLSFVLIVSSSTAAFFSLSSVVERSNGRNPECFIFAFFAFEISSIISGTYRVVKVLCTELAGPRYATALTSFFHRMSIFFRKQRHEYFIKVSGF